MLYLKPKEGVIDEMFTAAQKPASSENSRLSTGPPKSSEQFLVVRGLNTATAELRIPCFERKAPSSSVNQLPPGLLSVIPSMAASRVKFTPSALQAIKKKQNRIS